MEQIECVIQNKKKTLLISRSLFEDENGVKNTVLVIRDLTDKKRMEAQIKRKERLTAMGELIISSINRRESTGVIALAKWIPWENLEN